MIRYRPIQTCDPVNGPTYGIIGEENEESTWRAVSVVEDVTRDGQFAADLAEKCTRCQLSPLHLLDVIMDSLPE